MKGSVVRLVLNVHMFGLKWIYFLFISQLSSTLVFSMVLNHCYPPLRSQLADCNPMEHPSRFRTSRERKNPFPCICINSLDSYSAHCSLVVSRTWKSHFLFHINYQLSLYTQWINSKFTKELQITYHPYLNDIYNKIFFPEAFLIYNTRPSVFMTFFSKWSFNQMICYIENHFLMGLLHLAMKT